MEESTLRIKFPKRPSPFYDELSKEVNSLLTRSIVQNANKTLLVKFLFYVVLFGSLYALLYHPHLVTSPSLLTVNYFLLGLSGILLAFNCSHDAAHNTFSKNKKLNALVYYLSFNLQGVNAALWKKRHIASHHIFPNVDGCDADIDDNPFIRLSTTHRLKKQHKYQHLYATFIYCLYTLHWILLKDFIYLNKKEVANMKNQTYSLAFILELLALKAAYFTYMIVLPFLFTDLPLERILSSFLFMHFGISLFFVFTLIISHLSLETAFPTTDEQGYLPYDYYEHQLAVSLDYHPRSRVANWIFGGFNSHSAHHLFPELPHTLYTIITPAIQEVALKHQMPYHEMSIPKAIVSHFKYLKKLGE